MNVLAPQTDQTIQPMKVRFITDFFSINEMRWFSRRTKIQCSIDGIIENSVRCFNYAIEHLIMTKVSERKKRKQITKENVDEILDEKSYMLEFTNDRVGPSSVKNFQLIMEMDNRKWRWCDWFERFDRLDDEHVVMQFGRISDDTFTCDYRYPLSAIQAFGIALSAFDSRLTRE